MAKQDLVIRIAGEAGEGVLSTGQLLAQAAARGGFKVITYFSPPAEIKGGHSFFQIRLSSTPIYTEGDSLDILLAFNQEAYDRSIHELRADGLLIYDSSQVNPPEVAGRQQVALPLTEIAKTRLKFELGKNVVAVGAVSALFSLPTEHSRRLLFERFGRKGEEVLNKNYAALDAGMSYVEEHFGERSHFVLTPGKPDSGNIVVSGNQAIGLGALAAGVRFFAGYPITPASDIMEFLAENLPKVGGTLVQAEDEIASIGMVLGASFAGRKAMTSTSGPGLSLMVEMLGLGSMAELPAVVVDAQRAGPSTGMPTRHEQGDLYLAALGGHGEIQRIVIAPVSVEDCFYQTINAFNLSERYQMPVVLLTDTVLAVRTENVPKPDVSAVEVEYRKTYHSNGSSDLSGNGHRYKRYDLSAPDGVSPMSLPGMPGGQYTATGLEHSELARPRYDVKTHSDMTDKRFRKMEAARKAAPVPLRYGKRGASIGVITWGSTTGAVIEAIDLLAGRGVEVEMLAPKMLRPLPDHQIKEFLDSHRAVLVPEVNYTGQLAEMIASQYQHPLTKINTYGGVAFKVHELAEQIESSAERAAEASSSLAAIGLLK